MEDLQKYNLIVIGSGPGGYPAAIRASQKGLTVAVVESADLGGICLNWGCIPTKAILKSAEILNQIKKADTFGITVENVSVNPSKIIDRSREVVSQLTSGIAHLLKKNKIDVIKGHGLLKNAHTVSVTNGKNKTRDYLTDNILIATGARPRSIPGITIDGKQVLASNHAMMLKEVPKEITIIGAGAVGVEFAYYFQSIGSQVNLVEMASDLVPNEDHDISKHLLRSFKKMGMQIHTNSQVKKVTHIDGGVLATVASQDKEIELSSKYVLMAIGLQGNVESLNLETVGVGVEKGFITTNPYYQTNVDGVYAIGDVIGPPLLAHVATHEAMIAIDHIVGETPHPMNYFNIPGCTYCNPQIASVGYTELEARRQGYTVAIGKFPLQASGKALALGDTDGFIKVIFDKTYGECLGCHIIGPGATEIITEIALAKGMEATRYDIQNTVHPHPTLSEGILEAVGSAFNEAIHI